MLSRRLPEVSDSELRRGIREAVRSGSVYGLRTPEALRSYVCLSFLLGRQLDRDPRHPWAGEILRDRRRSPRGKARALWACARLENEEKLRGWLDD